MCKEASDILDAVQTLKNLLNVYEAYGTCGGDAHRMHEEVIDKLEAVAQVIDTKAQKEQAKRELVRLLESM